MCAASRRPLDLGERYFRLLGQFSPMALVCGAELPRAVSADELRTAWQHVGDEYAVPRLRIDDGAAALVRKSTGTKPRIETGAADALLSRELATGFAKTGTLARLIAAEDEGATTLFLTAHHAIGDARALLPVLRAVVERLERAGAGLTAESNPRRNGLPPALLENTRVGLRWPEDRLAIVPILRALAAKQRTDSATAAEFDGFPRPTASSPVVDSIITRLDPSQTEALLSRVRSAGCKLTGWIAAAAMLASRAVLKPTGQRIALAIPVDLRPRLEPPAALDSPGVAVSLLGTSLTVPASPALPGSSESTAELITLAKQVGERVSVGVESGEGELFYALAAPDRLSLDGRGAERVRASLSAAHDAIAVSNIGTFARGASEAAPPSEFAVRYWAALPPTPNQLAFISFLTTSSGLTMISTSTRLGRSEHRSWLHDLRERCSLLDG